MSRVGTMEAIQILLVRQYMDLRKICVWIKCLDWDIILSDSGGKSNICWNWCWIYIYRIEWYEGFSIWSICLQVHCYGSLCSISCISEGSKKLFRMTHKTNFKWIFQYCILQNYRYRLAPLSIHCILCTVTL